MNQVGSSIASIWLWESIIKINVFNILVFGLPWLLMLMNWSWSDGLGWSNTLSHSNPIIKDPIWSEGEFRSVFWNWTLWKSGVFKKCGMKLDFFFKKAKCLVKSVKKCFLKKLSIWLALIKVIVWEINFQKELCIYKENSLF